MRKLSLFVLTAGLFSIGAVAASQTEVPMVAGSVSFLESVFLERQYEYLPISPPTEAVYVHREKDVIPVDWTEFPSRFTQLMVAEMECGWFPVYRVRIYEDPATRQTVFLNTCGRPGV